MSKFGKGFYCSANEYVRDRHDSFVSCLSCFGENGCDGCRNYNRKWPTPEQYREEYGKEYNDDWPVWILIGTWNKELFCKNFTKIKKTGDKND